MLPCNAYLSANILLMKTVALVALCLLAVCNVHAQKFMELNDEFMTLYKAERYAEAAVVGEKALKQAKLEFGTVHLNYAISLQNLGECYTMLQQFDKALPNYRQSAQSYERIYKTNEVQDIAVINSSIASIHFLQNRYDSAIHYFKKTLVYFKKYTDDNEQNLIETYKNLKDSYFTITDYDNLAAICTEALPVIAAEMGKDNETYYEMAYFKGMALYNTGDLDGSEAALRESLAVLAELAGTNNFEYVSVLFTLANTVKTAGKSDEAVALLNQSISIHELLAEKNSIILSTSYKLLGDIYTDKASYAQAVAYFNKGLSLLTTPEEQVGDVYFGIRQSLAYCYVQGGNLLEAKAVLQQLLSELPADDIRRGELLIVLANAEVQMNELAAAEEHANAGYALLGKSSKEGHALQGNAKEVLGMVYNKMGNTRRSIETFKEAVAILSRFYGAESRGVASVYSNMGITYFEAGDYALAEIAYENSLNIRRKVVGVKHPEYALSLMNLGMVHVYQARYIEADKLMVEAMNIYIEAGMTGTTNFIFLVNNIALMAEQQGMYKDAKALYYQLLQIMKDRKEQNSMAAYTVYNNLSKLYFSTDQPDSAAYYAQQGIDILKAEGKTNTKEYIKTTNNLLLAYKEMKDYARANALAKEIVPLTIKVMGEESELLGLVYSNLGILSMMQNRNSEAAAYLQASADITLKNYRDNFYVLSEKEKLGWWEERAFAFTLLPSLLVTEQSASGKWVEAMTDQQLQLKGFVLNDAAASLRRARAQATPALKKILDAWQFNKTLLGKMYALPVAQRTLNTDSLEAVTNTLEKQVSQSAGGLQVKSLNWKDVQAALKADEAAIEFMHFPYYKDGAYTDTVYYAAIVISKQSPPRFVPLGSEKAIAALLSTDENSKEAGINKLYRSSIRSAGNNSSFRGDSLYAMIWQPLMQYLKGINMVSFAPDGILHKVAFHALPAGGGKILIDSVQLQQYSGIRQLAENRSMAGIKWSKAHLVGNPDFSKSVTPSGKVVSFTGNNGGWNPLPGTAAEINLLKQLFSSAGVSVTTRSGAEANEENFKTAIVARPQILHIATHGFFLQRKEEYEIDGTAAAGESVLAGAENPLLRSGLILAGANAAWQGDKTVAGAEDGILNAWEISQLDLSDTRLVVLSACETALGDVQGTEGVFGLQRAFKIAGVQQMIVSLWQVPDKETAELMKAFYTHLLKGNTVRAAFYNAQKDMRMKYSPYLWAAFTLVE